MVNAALHSVTEPVSSYDGWIKDLFKKKKKRDKNPLLTQMVSTEKAKLKSLQLRQQQQQVEQTIDSEKQKSNVTIIAAVGIVAAIGVLIYFQKKKGKKRAK